MPLRSTVSTTGPSKTPTLNNVDWNSSRNQATLKIRGRPLVVYPPKSINKDEIDHFYKHLADTNKKGQRVKKQPPKGFPIPENSEYHLDTAFGYRGNDARRNLYSLKSREIIYFVAGVVIIQDPFVAGKQRIFNKHTDDINCLAVHSDGVTIATGQICGLKADDSRRPAHILIWNSDTFEVIKKLGVGQIFKAPIALCFSYPDKNEDSNWISCVDEHSDHTLRVWNWTCKESDPKPRIEKPTTKDTVVGVEFFPFCNGDTRYMVAFGKQLTFYSLTVNGGKDENKRVIDVVSKKRNAIFEKTQKPKIIVSVCITKTGHLITGGTDGLIISWGDNSHAIADAGKSPKPNFMFTAHKGAVFTMSNCLGSFQSHEECFYSGGKDGIVSVWNLSDVQKNLAPIHSVTLPSSARCIASTFEEEGMVIGTTQNEIYTVFPNKSPSELVIGHTGEIWALAVTDKLVISGSDDGRLVVRDSLTGLHKWNVKLTEAIKSVAVQPGTDNIFVGTDKGKIVGFSCESDELMTNDQANDELVCMEWNYDGSLLACGSKDQSIYLFEYKNLDLVKGMGYHLVFRIIRI